MKPQVSADNFTREQDEEEKEELGTNMAAPVGAPSSITVPSLPSISMADFNDRHTSLSH